MKERDAIISDTLSPVYTVAVDITPCSVTVLPSIKAALRGLFLTKKPRRHPLNQLTMAPSADQAPRQPI
jgi:hypothetical protein